MVSGWVVAGALGVGEQVVVDAADVDEAEEVVIQIVVVGANVVVTGANVVVGTLLELGTVVSGYVVTA